MQNERVQGAGGNGLPDHQIASRINRFFHRDKVVTAEDRLRLTEPSLMSLSDDVVAAIRTTYAMEGKRRNAIDFDVAPEDRILSKLINYHVSAPTKPEWREIIIDLHNLSAEAHNLEPPKEPRMAYQLQFLQDYLDAHLIYYGQRTPPLATWKEKVEVTQGFDPKKMDESYIKAQLDVVKNLFGGKWDAESITRFLEQRPLSPAEFANEITQHSQEVLSAVGRFLGREKEMQPTFKVDIDNVDEYWINWTDGKRNNFRLRVNAHPRHASKLTTAKAWAMTMHEIGGHIDQMYGWQKAIDQGRTIPALGITSLHVPEQVACEGIAQTLHHYVPELLKVLPPEALFQIEFYGLKQLAYYNLQIDANIARAEGHPVDLKDATDFIRRMANPAETEEEVKKQLRERTGDGEKNPYLLAYGRGFLLHRQIATGLKYDGKKKFLDLIYSQPTSPRQEIEIAQQLASNPRYGLGTMANIFD